MRQMVEGLHIARPVPAGALLRAQERNRSTEKRVTCDDSDFASHAVAILSVPSVWLSCSSRAGNAEGELSEEMHESGVGRDERLLYDFRLGQLFTVPI